VEEIICEDSSDHFHQVKLPIAVSQTSLEWINFMKKYYSLLLERVKKMNFNYRISALKPLTFISLFMKQSVELNKESSIEHGLFCLLTFF
jgi:hypothetical protein